MKVPCHYTLLDFNLYIEIINYANDANDSHFSPTPFALLNFVGNPRQDMPKGLPFNLTDYLQPVDWSGRLLREDKKG